MWQIFILKIFVDMFLKKRKGVCVYIKRMRIAWSYLPYCSSKTKASAEVETRHPTSRHPANILSTNKGAYSKVTEVQVPPSGLFLDPSPSHRAAGSHNSEKDFCICTRTRPLRRGYRRQMPRSIVSPWQQLLLLMWVSRLRRPRALTMHGHHDKSSIWSQTYKPENLWRSWYDLDAGCFHHFTLKWFSDSILSSCGRKPIIQSLGVSTRLCRFM